MSLNPKPVTAASKPVPTIPRSYLFGFILVGLALYVTGCFLFIPAGTTQQFVPFLFAYLIMTSGLSFLETSANPYILSMGPAETATRRLNLAQAFNPMGSLRATSMSSLHPISFLVRSSRLSSSSSPS